MDKVVHFEIPYKVKKRAVEFYKNIFAWNVNDMPQMNYTIVHSVVVDEKMMPKRAGAINGGMFKKTKDLRNPLITIDVQDIDEKLNMIKEIGGKVLREKVAVGDMGFVAYFKDTEGNIVGLWENAKKE